MNAINLLTLSLVCAQRQCIKDPSSEGSNISVWFGNLDVLRGPFPEQLGTIYGSQKNIENICLLKYYADEP
jgi:hypothetical protein